MHVFTCSRFRAPTDVPHRTPQLTPAVAYKALDGHNDLADCVALSSEHLTPPLPGRTTHPSVDAPLRPPHAPGCPRSVHRGRPGQSPAYLIP